MPKVMNGCWTELNWVTGKRTVASTRNESLGVGGNGVKTEPTRVGNPLPDSQRRFHPRISSLFP
jgi:hypothetical protein